MQYFNHRFLQITLALDIMSSPLAPRRSQRSVHNPEKAVKYLSGYHPLDEVTNPNIARRKRHSVGKYSQLQDADGCGLPVARHKRPRPPKSSLAVEAAATDSSDDSVHISENDDHITSTVSIPTIRRSNKDAGTQTDTKCRLPYILVTKKVVLEFPAYRQQYQQAWEALSACTRFDTPCPDTTADTSFTLTAPESPLPAAHPHPALITNPYLASGDIEAATEDPELTDRDSGKEGGSPQNTTPLESIELIESYQTQPTQILDSRRRIVPTTPTSTCSSTSHSSTLKRREASEEIVTPKKQRTSESSRETSNSASPPPMQAQPSSASQQDSQVSRYSTVFLRALTGIEDAVTNEDSQILPDSDCGFNSATQPSEVQDDRVLREIYPGRSGFTGDGVDDCFPVNRTRTSLNRRDSESEREPEKENEKETKRPGRFYALRLQDT